jgi:release factor glutamine methyltransferase
VTPWREALVETVKTLRAAGVPDASREAPLLLAMAAGMSREAWLTAPPDLDASMLSKLRLFTARRVERVPLAYIRGCQEFFGLSLLVGPGVLVPRPETEHLVEVALRATPREAGRVVDVGTGSGAVALALAIHGWPGWQVEGVDIDRNALALAAANRARLNRPGVRLYRSDLLDRVEPPLLAVVANLPYVGREDPVDPEVRWEPTVAVYAPGEPLSLIRRVVIQAARRLAPGGILALEVGWGQAPAVTDLLARAGFDAIAGESDLAGTVRVVWGRWTGA